MMPSHPAEPTEIAALLRKLPAFAELSDVALADLVASSSMVRFAPGDLLICQGEMSETAFLLLTGEVEVTVESSFGAVHVARVAGNTLLGEIGVFAHLPRIAAVRAETPVEALELRRDDLLRAGRAAPALLLAIIRQLGERLGTINRAIGFHTHALAALEQHDFDPQILEELRNPVPELIDFAQSFRRMAEQIALRRRQHDEMASAATIQRAMLPAPLPPGDTHRFDLHAEMRPAREVGGDFYDFFLLDPDHLGIAIGDVCGKGIPAALFMAITRTALRLVAREHGDVGDAIRRANGLLSVDNASQMFATLFYGVLDLRRGELVYGNCGHNPPYLLRGDGTHELLRRTGPPIAVMEDAVYTTRVTPLAAGDRLFLYTDGITEAIAADGSEFGDERLAQVLASLADAAAPELVSGVLGAVDAFAAGAPQFDDLTSLALRYTPLPQK